MCVAPPHILSSILRLLQAVARARERPSKSSRLVSLDDTFHRSVGADRQEEKADDNDENIDDCTPNAPDTSRLVPSWPVVRPSHTDVRNTPENPAEEAVEKRAHQRQQIAKERNDLGDDEGKDPGASQNGCPSEPADKRVVAEMACAGVQAEEDEASGDGCIEHTQEDQRRNHEAERNLEEGLVTERAECGSGVVVRACISVDDAADEREKNDFADGHSPERLREILRFLHFRDEGRDGDLTDERVTDIQKRIHATDEGSSSDWDNVDRWFSEMGPGFRWCYAARMVFDSRKYGCE